MENIKFKEEIDAALAARPVEEDGHEWTLSAYRKDRNAPEGRYLMGHVGKDGTKNFIRGSREEMTRIFIENVLSWAHGADPGIDPEKAAEAALSAACGEYEKKEDLFGGCKQSTEAGDGVLLSNYGTDEIYLTLDGGSMANVSYELRRVYGYGDVNKGVNEAMEYVESIRDVWGRMRTLKVYDVFFKEEEILDKYPLTRESYGAEELFRMFCESAYDQFTDWLAEEGVEDQRKYVGRTSSFYLTDVHDRKKYILGNLIEAAAGMSDYCTFTLGEDGRWTMDRAGWGDYSEEDILELAQDEMEYYAGGEFLKDVKKFFENAVREADYIDSFMADQTGEFEEYLSCRENDLEYEAEEAGRVLTDTMACFI